MCICFFLSGLMGQMGFGDNMLKLTYTIGDGSISNVILKWRRNNLFSFEDQLNKSAAIYYCHTFYYC